MKPLYQSRGPLAASRFLFLLGLAVWLGGLAFVAVGAPAMFRVNRILGPQMVGAGLSSFTPVTYICAFLMLLGWLGEGLRRGEIQPGARKLWVGQGVLTVLMLALALYVGRTLMPQMNSLQPQVVAATMRAADSKLRPEATPQEAAVRARFDGFHKRYRSVTSSVVLLGLATLLLFSVRISRSPWNSETESAVGAEDSLFVVTQFN